jgi:hypothetical protein
MIDGWRLRQGFPRFADMRSTRKRGGWFRYGTAFAGIRRPSARSIEWWLFCQSASSMPRLAAIVTSPRQGSKTANRGWLERAEALDWLNCSERL